MKIRITQKPLSIDKAYRTVLRKDCGAVCVFTGNVRNHHEGKRVRRIHYTAFEEMALKELEKIVLQMKKRWKIGEVYIAHRTGRLKIGEISVIVAVSAFHRKEAFESCRYGIDTLKKTVPIWKEEFYAKGKAWVSG